MSAISLSAGERSNLLALQATADLVQATQQKLATGKRVNSALDNPSSYFTARNLDNRAGDLSALLDGIGQAQQAIAQANNGLTAIEKLVQSAQSLAQQAKQTPNNYYSASALGTANVTPPQAGSVTGGFDLTNFHARFAGLLIRVGATSYSVPPTADVTDLDGVVDAINNATGLGPSGAVTASKDASGHLVLTSNSATPLGVDPTGSAMTFGLLNPDLTQVVPGLSGTSLTVQVDAATPLTVTFGTGAGQVATFRDLQQALAPAGVGANLVEGPTFLVIGAPDPQNKQGTFTVTGTAAAALGLSPTAQDMSVSPPSATRESLRQQYNAILRQIDQLASDSGYNGINLLQGGQLGVNFNENGSSSIAINGSADDAATLGLSDIRSGGFQSNEDVDTYIGQLTAALATLRKQASAFSGNLTTVQVRQDFTKQMISTLQSGADALTLADSNAEGANLLALQTRQQLSTTALSLASQSSQSVLRLFG